MNAAAVLTRLHDAPPLGRQPSANLASAVLTTRSITAAPSSPAAEPARDNEPSVSQQPREIGPPSSTSLPALDEAKPVDRAERVHAATATASAAALSPVYVKAGDLDKSPVPLADIAPEYPEAAASQRGHVVLELFINESGSVDRVDLVSATPPGVFDESALAAFQQAKFEPGRRLGLPSRSRMTIEVDYKPADQNGQISPTRY